MFTYLDNQFSPNWLNNGTINSTTTPTGVDIVNAIGPVLLTVQVPTGGSGTLSVQPVMSTAGTTGPWVNVPADAILDPVTGLQTTFANIAGSAGTGAAGASVYLKRDELERYISVTFTPVGAGSMTVNLFEGHLRAYTSTSV